jgi:hypothetical protein
MGHKKTSVMGCRKLFEGSGVHNSNTGIQITQDVYINGYFLLLFDLTPDREASEEHTSHSDILKFSKPLLDAITCLLHLEFDNSIYVDYSRTATIDL